MKISPERIGISCPACASPISADVWRIVDVGQEPDLKRQFLRGQLNVATCPHCSHRAAVATTLAYHDPDKELFLILLPNELGLSGEEQEKSIGQLTNLLMTSLPAEQRKGYLFQPKTFFSMQNLMEEILRADGITGEMMQDQIQKSQLVRELLATRQDEASLKELVEEKRDQLDYEFFLVLTASIDQAKEDGDEILAEQLTALRVSLQELIQPPKVPSPEDMGGEITREELIEELFSHRGEDEFKTLVAVARPLLDYQFFQTLTGQIESAEGQGEKERAKQLTQLRSETLDLVDELDQEAKEALDRATNLLRQILDSQDTKAAAEENLEQIDAVFLSVLEANIVAAGEAEQEEILGRLRGLREHVMSLLEARMPPEMRLINRLFSIEGLEERRELLQLQAELIDEQFLQLMRLVIQDLGRQGHETAAEHLGESVGHVEAMLESAESDTSSE